MPLLGQAACTARASRRSDSLAREIMCLSAILYCSVRPGIKKLERSDEGRTLGTAGDFTRVACATVCLHVCREFVVMLCLQCIGRAEVWCGTRARYPTLIFLNGIAGQTTEGRPSDCGGAAQWPLCLCHVRRLPWFGSHQIVIRG